MICDELGASTRPQNCFYEELHFCRAVSHLINLRMRCCWIPAGGVRHGLAVRAPGVEGHGAEAMRAAPGVHGLRSAPLPPGPGPQPRVANHTSQQPHLHNRNHKGAQRQASMACAPPLRERAPNRNHE